MFENTKSKLADEFSGKTNEGLREEILSRLASYERGVCPIPHISNLVTVLFHGIGLTEVGRAKRKAVLEVFEKELNEFILDSLRIKNAQVEAGKTSGRRRKWKSQKEKDDFHNARKKAKRKANREEI